MKVNIMIEPVLILDESETLSYESYEGHVSYKDWGIDFLEKDGLYAYSEFFIECASKKDQTVVKMVCGEWYSSISDMISSSHFKNNQGAINNKVNSPSFDLYEFQNQFNNCMSKFKNGESLIKPRFKDMAYIEC